MSGEETLDSTQSPVGISEPGEFHTHLPDLDDWLTSVAPSSRYGYRKHLREWLAHCLSRDLDPLEARTADITRWPEIVASWPCASCRSGHYSPATARRRQAAVRSWYGWLARNGWLRTNPAYGARGPKADSVAKGRAFTVNEADAMFDAAQTMRSPQRLRNIAMLEMERWLGMRSGAVSGLDVADLGETGGRRVVTFYDKGGKRLTRVLGPDLARALDTYLHARAACEQVELDRLTGPLFVTGTGGRVSPGQVWAITNRIGRAAGIRGQVAPHGFRSAFVMHLRSAGVGLEVIQTALGHSTAETTRRYDRAAQRVQQDPTDLLPYRRASRT